MPLLKTRYRDIPLEKLEHPVLMLTKHVWDDCRGLNVIIATPPVEDFIVYVQCKGPHYRLIAIENEQIDRGAVVCPHIVEIGD